MPMSIGLPRPVFSRLWRHQKVLKGTVSSPVYPKTVSADAASSWSKRELYRVRVVNQLAALLRMRIHNVHVPGYPGTWAGRIMLHTRVYFSRMCYQIAPRFFFSAFIILVGCL